ncbi:restriction endonuclease subunit S [Aeromonas caviae]|uniref:restriction endonuclease subunit S n=1 Tax=Aeromonas caviae TaxID=648 RepID=UPI0038D0E53C
MAALKIENLITDHLDLWTAAVRPKSSAGRGSNSKLELTGIKKLRELILELAVRGKLVPQDPSDEPASVLLERITAEKAQLVKEGKIKKPKALPEIGEEDKPFELPEGWKWDKVGNLATIVRGVSYPKHQVSENNKMDYITLLRANNINGSLNFDSTIYVPRMLVKEEQVILAGDIVIAMSSGSPDLVGKAAQSNVDLDATFGTFCGVVRVIDSVLKDFFGFLFTTPLYRKQTQLAGKGIGIKNLNKDNLDNLDIPIPPLKEQRRIVAKVDELMALCDQLEQCSESQLAAHQTLVETQLTTLTDSCDADELAQNWARLSTHFDTLFTTEASIDALKQTILQLAVMGKLVPQDPSDEPASTLLARIAAEKAQLVKEKKIKKEKPLSVIREDEKPFELPQGWEWERFGKIFLDLKYGTSQRSDYLIDGNPVLRIPNVVGGAISLDDLKFSKLSLTELNDLALIEGDLLFIRSNGSLGIVGRCVVVDICLDGFAFAGYLVRSRMPKRDFCSHFISLAMDTSYVRNQIEQPIRSTSGVKNINSTEISNLIIPVPPLLEQHRIVAKVNELMVICDQLKSRLQTRQQIQLALAESLVEGALA